MQHAHISDVLNFMFLYYLEREKNLIELSGDIVWYFHACLFVTRMKFDNWIWDKVCEVNDKNFGSSFKENFDYFLFSNLIQSNL